MKHLSDCGCGRVYCCLVYADGRVCISILHAPGDDPMGYESSSERWSPVQSVEKILLSVVSMLAGMSLWHVSHFSTSCTKASVETDLYYE